MLTAVPGDSQRQSTLFMLFHFGLCVCRTSLKLQLLVQPKLHQPLPCIKTPQEQLDAGLSSDRVVLAGFSQGGAVVLEAALGAGTSQEADGGERMNCE